MLKLNWFVAGLVIGMLISTILVPPNRKIPSVPTPHDDSVYHTTSGCVKIASTEVPCTAEPDSLNLLASKQ